MTNDQPIRFRTFADEDEASWGKRDEPRADHNAGPAPFEPEQPHLGAAIPPAKRVRARNGGVFAWGTGLALVAGVVIAVTLLPKAGSVATRGRTPGSSLQVHRFVALESGELAAAARLPCYVNGASVGALTLAGCGQRNGVASGRLDVGLSSSPPSLAPGEALPAPTVATVAGETGVRLARTATPSYAGAAAEAPRSYAQNDEDRSDSRSIDPEDSIGAAQTFYEGLSDADGARAASVVVPEKRREGPLSAVAISRFYSSLQAPLRLTRLYATNDHTVVARYTFVDRDGGVCRGTARVTTTQRDGEVYVQGVRALNGC